MLTELQARRPTNFFHKKLLVLRSKFIIKNLKKQYFSLESNTLSFSVWLLDTFNLFHRLFPKNAAFKIQELKELLDLPPYYLNYSETEQIQAKRSLALFFMAREIEEVQERKP